MNPQTASRTALATSLMRAFHTRADPHPILSDPWGDRLVPADVRQSFYAVARGLHPSLPELADEATVQSVVDAGLRISPGYPNVITRSRFAEDALHRAMARGVRQYVLIGAGFDSYALRMPAIARGLSVIEIDHPATQSLKRERIAASGAVLPGSVHFAAADLSVEDLPSVLARSAFRASEPAFFSWLGVTMYLSREANFTTFRAIASVAAPGSELVFSYTDQSLLAKQRGDESESRRELQRSVAALGEPFVCGFDPAILGQDLRQLGYTVEEDLSDVDLVQLYDPQGLNNLQASGVSRVALVRVGNIA